MRNKLKKTAAILAAVLFVLLMPMTVLADGSDVFISLGADLSEEQKQTVLGKMGISNEEFANCKVAYVTNAMEHQYLDGSIPADVIGTRALSCVKVTKSDPGSGIRVTTEDIDYCTVGMYKNALITSGVEDAEVYVTGPMRLSGTAALIGAWLAYEQLSGENIGEDRRETAMDEMVVIGELSNPTDGEAALDLLTGEAVTGEKMEELYSYVKAEVVANGLTDPEKVKEVLEQAEQQYNVTLTDSQKQKLTELMPAIAGLDIDPAKLIEQAGDLYDKYGETVLSHAKEAYNEVVTDEVKQSFWQFVGTLVNSIFNSIKNKISNNG
ncbi:MAG: DUF1002 domain-containing protein [Lachnospiraceae bacterium]|nr:DUF1002 domain-containing protein [Lachnospiraceae bacterium]